jgi:glycogen operon protein
MPEDWQVPYARCLSFLLAGAAARRPVPDGEPGADDDFFVILNAHDEEIRFQLPPRPEAARWRRLIDTASADPFTAAPSAEPGSTYRVQPRSLVVLSSGSGSGDA